MTGGNLDQDDPDAVGSSIHISIRPHGFAIGSRTIGTPAVASREVATLIADATPYVTAAVGAYGGAVLAKVRDDAADATVGVGRRLL